MPADTRYVFAYWRRWMDARLAVIARELDWCVDCLASCLPDDPVDLQKIVGWIEQKQRE
jgi:hypothetical protein